MSLYFGLSIRFLGQRFHGRQDGDEPEWPPSPLRVFQALVASAARMGRGNLAPRVLVALKWLERRSAESPPLIFGPHVPPADLAPSGYCLSVPNNAMDIVAKAWCRGNYSNKGDASPATHRTMKTVRPTHLLDGDSVFYLWSVSDPVPQEIQDHTEILTQAARRIAVLGWGIDMAVGDGSILSAEQVDALPGERWLPSAAVPDGGALRAPVPGTLEDLSIRHKGFLNRLEGNVFTPPPPLSVFGKLDYRRAIDPPNRPVAAFSLLKLDASGFRAFDTTKWALAVAGMTRHATRCAAKRSAWADSRVNTFILGHAESRGDRKHASAGNRRFAYLPLPSIEARGQGKAPVVGNVRRVMLTVLDEGCNNDIAWIRRALSGQMLEMDRGKSTDCVEGSQQAVALLSLLPNTDTVVQAYMRPSTAWATVTPVVLPGYDDPAHYRRRLKRGTSEEDQKRLLNCLNERVETLIRKAIVQAGFSQLLADYARIEWRKVGYWRGADVADRYGVPDHLKRFPRYHVRIQWRDENRTPVPIKGPMCLGGGRFYGLGLFAADFVG